MLAKEKKTRILKFDNKTTITRASFSFTKSENRFISSSSFYFQRLNELHRMHLILIGKFETVRAYAEKRRKQTSIGNDVPRERECDILVATQTISIIPEVVFGIHVLEVEHSVLAAQDYLVPDDNLKALQS